MMVEKFNDEKLLKEYYEVFHIVNEFDKRLLTVKGWGVTLSLAALAWGFQQSHYGLFLVAALSGLVFWIIESAMKRHQMRYYFRMREIEVLQYEREENGLKNLSAPRIDSSWSHAGKFYSGESPLEYRPEFKEHKSENHESEEDKSKERGRWTYINVWRFIHVLLPHVLSILAGLLFFILGICGILGDMKW